jgi:hypothetical protein
MKKIFTFFIAGIVAVALFELFLRFSPFSYGISPVVYDKDIGMWHKKSFSSVWIKPCYHTPFYFDEKGLIKKSYHYDSAKKDILIFGDSYMEALMVENKNVMHNALYDAYEGAYNFLNYGLSETSAMQQLIMMEKKVDFSNVKAVVQFIRIESDIYDVNPDTFDDTTARPKVFLAFKDLEHYTLIPPRAEDFKEQLRDILGNFELYVFLKKGIYYLKQKLAPKKEASEQKNKREDLHYNWLQMKGSIYQTKKLLASKGVAYIVMLYGKDVDLNSQLIAFLKEQDIRYYDILALAKKEGFRLEGFSCDSHWSDKTHQNVANLIKKEGLIP